MAEVLKIKWKDTEAYCEALENKNASVEQILESKRKELTTTIRHKDHEMAECSRRSSDLRKENTTLKEEISERKIYEQTLLHENKNRTGVTFSEDVQ